MSDQRARVELDDAMRAAKDRVDAPGDAGDAVEPVSGERVQLLLRMQQLALHSAKVANGELVERIGQLQRQLGAATAALAKIQRDRAAALIGRRDRVLLPDLLAQHLTAIEVLLVGVHGDGYAAGFDAGSHQARQYAGTALLQLPGRPR